MKRILFFLLLLVNLQLTTDNGSLSIGFGEVSAQRVQDTQLTKATTRGWGDKYECDCDEVFYDIDSYTYHIKYDCTYNERCKDCGEYPIWRCKMWEHQNYYCPYRWVFCSICRSWTQAIDIENDHRCHIPCYCAWCKTRLADGEACFCTGAMIYGQRKVPEDEWINNYDGHIPDSNNGVGGIGGGKNPNSKTEDERHPHKPFQELKKSSNIKWLGNKRATIASENLKRMIDMHPQQHGTHECVPRAFAFMEELWYGVDFETAFKRNIQKCKDANIHISREGFEFEDILRMQNQEIWKNDPTVIRYKNDLETIKDCIDNGIPVATVILDSPLHMVVIIGYDEGNESGSKFYVAGGNPECDVSIIGVMLRDNNYDYVYGIKH